MANVIKIRRSSVPSKVPTTSDIALGELAVNIYDGKLYLKKSTTGNETGTGTSVVEVGAGVAMTNLIDTSTTGVIYIGNAPQNTAESASAWTIIKTTYTTAGIRTARGTATNVTWTGRTGHTYT